MPMHECDEEKEVTICESLLEVKKILHDSRWKSEELLNLINDKILGIGSEKHYIVTENPGLKLTVSNETEIKTKNNKTNVTSVVSDLRQTSNHIIGNINRIESLLNKNFGLIVL